LTSSTQLCRPLVVKRVSHRFFDPVIAVPAESRSRHWVRGDSVGSCGGDADDTDGGTPELEGREGREVVEVFFFFAVAGTSHGRRHIHYNGDGDIPGGTGAAVATPVAESAARLSRGGGGKTSAVWGVVVIVFVAATVRS